MGGIGQQFSSKVIGGAVLIINIAETMNTMRQNFQPPEKDISLLCLESCGFLSIPGTVAKWLLR